MGKFACFLGGVVAGVVALGAASYWVSEKAARETIERDDSDDGCLSAATDAAKLSPATETNAAA